MPTSESHSAKILRSLTPARAIAGCAELYRAKSRSLAPDSLFEVSTTRECGTSGTGLRLFRNKTNKVDIGNRTLSTHIDRLIGIVYQNDPANIGNWMEYCKQRGTPEKITMVELSGSITTTDAFITAPGRRTVRRHSDFNSTVVD